MGKRRRITLLGKRYELRFVSRLGPRDDPNAGTCDHPEQPRKAIRILGGLDEKTELSVVLHECLHALDWHKEEEWVQQAGVDLADVLWALGWRKGSTS